MKAPRKTIAAETDTSLFFSDLLRDSNPESLIATFKLVPADDPHARRDGPSAYLFRDSVFELASTEPEILETIREDEE